MPVSHFTPSTSTPLKMAIANAFAVAMLVALSGVPATALADGPKQTNSAGPDQAVIAGQSFDGVAGAIRLNQTAGNGNAQANVIVITNGAGVKVRLIQQTDATGTVDGRASILDQSFSGAVGAIQVNQSAGNGNAQGNLILLELGSGTSELNDGTLRSMVSEQHTGGYAGPHGTNVVGASPGAFAKASGIVQVDQVAGTGNSTANSFHLQIQLGTGDP